MVYLRADKQTSDTVVLQTFRDGAWCQVLTGLAGTDIYAAELDGLGQFALVRLPAGVQATAVAIGPAAEVRLAPDPAGGSGPGSRLLYLVAGVLLVLVAVGLLLARRRMRR